MQYTSFLTLVTMAGASTLNEYYDSYIQAFKTYTEIMCHIEDMIKLLEAHD